MFAIRRPDPIKIYFGHTSEGAYFFQILLEKMAEKTPAAAGGTTMLARVPDGMNPAFYAMSLLRRRRYEEASDLCTELLQKNNRDKVRARGKQQSCMALYSLHNQHQPNVRTANLGFPMC